MTLAKRTALRFDCGGYVEVKDPCPVHDGTMWHLFGTGVRPHRFELLHATAPEITGPWRLRAPVDVTTLEGGCVAAPGVIADGAQLHMFLQTDYNRHDGRIEHLVSDDGGQTFDHARTALTSLPGTDEAGIYDPHPAEVAGQRYLVYSAFSTIGQPDVHLARSASGTWDGPWTRLGPILRHEHVSCHNQRGADDYEWGLEGAQLVELPDGCVLLNGVCFLPDGAPGNRQRVFFAVAPDVTGPYEVRGPVVTPPGLSAGENGHGTVVVAGARGEDLALFFQERDGAGGPWRYALATTPVSAIARRTRRRPSTETAA